MHAICIGNFEGVHRGHAALLAAARRKAGASGRVTAVAFEPLPVEILRPGTIAGRLSTVEEKAARLRAAGADEVLMLETSASLLGLEPEPFMAEIRSRLSPSVIVEGPDFRFGRGRTGDVGLLAAIGDRLGFEVDVVPEICLPLPSGSLVPARSSLVRWLLGRGRVLDAAAILGRPYGLAGTVVPGDRQGRLLGCPTANLDHGHQLLPADGVYAGWAELPGGERAMAAISVGCKPTFEPTPPRCEVHVIGRDLPLDHYGWPIRVTFERWVRGQLVFAEVDALIAQMRRDIERIVRILRLVEATKANSEAPEAA
ncbi:MAG: riboflavin kinase [Phycisphaerales bacterium]|jgi:riboflavin kinase/FMN adenylyltransferase